MMKILNVLKKRQIVFSFLFVLIFHYAKSQTPLYFNIISHNESSDPYDYEGNQSDFNLLRNIVKELCDTVISKQAKYNFQPDANFIIGVLNWENGNVNPNNILEWANNSNFIDVDAHNHFVLSTGPSYNPYNFPDVAHLLDSCGVTFIHHVLGGVTYADTIVGSVIMQENWTQYASLTPGYTYPNYLWQADIVWGTASPSHVADYTRFGVWKPAGGSSPTDFGIHDPNGIITHVGGGCKEDVSYILDGQGNFVRTTDEVISSIKSIVDDIQNRPTTSNDFYTMNMLINFRDMPLIPSFADSIGKIIDGLQDYVNQGKIIWATLGEKHDLWYQQHSNPNDYFNVDCNDIPLSVNEVSINNNFIIYPNPTTGKLNFEGQFSANAHIIIYDVFGKTMFNNRLENYTINIQNLPNGVYLIQIKDGIKIYTKKIVKN